MKKVLRVLIIALALVGIMVVPALAGRPPGAGAAKLPLLNSPGEKDLGWKWCEGAINQIGPTVGFVILNTNASGDLIVQVSLKGVPNETYDIYVNQVNDACVSVSGGIRGTLTVNVRGNGNAHVQVPRIEDAEYFWVSAMERPLGLGQLAFRSTAIVLD